MEHFDVLIVGAGISGVGAAYHLTHEMPERSFVVLEALESFGGTWLTHKYPGVRSDSDLYTFGYRFKPWVGPPIATAGEILSYMGEVIDESDLARHIRYRHHISDGAWDSSTNLWTLHVTDGATGETLTFTTNFLWMCQGYYQHEQGYTPQWPGMERFQGQIVHPQTWPEDLDYAGKQIICIGSGATAATVVPAIAGDAAHVTVLQRSPTYFWTRPNRNETADMLRELDIPEEWVHEIVRRKILKDFGELTTFALTEPEMAREALMQGVRDALPEGYDVEKHFGPKYKPWQQRLALIPDGDLFEGIKAGRASMCTDEIESFTETGIRTKGGEELSADIIITATGFNISVLGGIQFTIDGAPLDLANTITYRGMMFTGVPNMLWVFGYFRASWTLRADLISDLVLRLFRLMDAKGVRRVTPHLRPQDESLPVLDWMADDNFNPNYLKRSMHLLPKRLDVPEWMHTQDYYAERDALPAADLDDGCLVFE